MTTVVDLDDEPRHRSLRVTLGAADGALDLALRAGRVLTNEDADAPARRASLLQTAPHVSSPGPERSLPCAVEIGHPRRSRWPIGWPSLNRPPVSFSHRSHHRTRAVRALRLWLPELSWAQIEFVRDACAENGGDQLSAICASPDLPQTCGSSCGCSDDVARSRALAIVWQRLVTGDSTCPRCATTQQAVERAVAVLAEVLAPLGITPMLKSRSIDREAFERAPGESNRIWIAGRPLEDWLGATVGSSRCCSVCGDYDCRTVEVDGASFEAIPETLIVKAGLLAAASLLAT